MEGLGGHYKAIGPTLDKNASKKSQTNKPPAKKKTAKKKTAKKQAVKKRAAKNRKKKTLGGIQGKLVVKTKHTDNGVAPPKRWCVGQSVNCKYTNGRYYWAFVSAANDDGTYDMYFPEEKRKDPVIKNVPSSHIKCPITSGYTSQALDKYIKKEFHDKGSTGEDPDDPYFEAGDFV